MPLIKVQTSVAAPEPNTVEGLLKTLSSKLSGHFGKSEAYVMTAFEPDVQMTFGGTTEPVCYIEIKNIGTMKPEQTQAMSQDFCQVVAENLGVPPGRVYIEFTDAQRHLWGWNGRTFG
ncbi:MAG: phenylpyruvate tautomerase MIF-related protein [Spirulinaceae cyanobacterium]